MCALSVSVATMSDTIVTAAMPATYSATAELPDFAINAVAIKGARPPATTALAIRFGYRSTTQREGKSHLSQPSSSAMSELQRFITSCRASGG